MIVTKQATQQALVEWVGNCQQGYWMTLDDMLIKHAPSDPIAFEQKLEKLSIRLNDFCYGRAFQRGEKRLKIAGGIEQGNFTHRLHAHLVVMHAGDVRRSLAEINHEVRKNWYRINAAKGTVYGNLVDVQEIGDLPSRINYAVKHQRSTTDQYCKLVML